MIVNSWKTALTGVVLIGGAIIGIINDLVNGKPVDFASYGAAIIAGVGLIAAKDSNVTGGTKEAK
jgi:hypothetical protein